MKSSVPENLAEAVWAARPGNGPWQSYNLSSASRTLLPKTVHTMEGEVKNADGILDYGGCFLVGKDALITLDFGVNTAGILSLAFGPGSDANQSIAVAFSESKQFIGRRSDRSMDFFVDDSFLSVPVNWKGEWKCPSAQMRGAFRYLTIYMETAGIVELSKCSVYNNAMPSLGDDLRNYSGYFYSDDAFLNTIWYAGAYTVQLSTIPTHTGRRCDWVRQKTGWFNDVPSCPEDYIEVLTDGAKRDRTVWSGDRAITQMTNFIAFNNSNAVKAGVDFMFEQQTDEGAFPYAAKPIWHYGSDTYHLWTFIALYNAFFYDGNESAKAWIKSKWEATKHAMQWALAKVDDTGLMKSTWPLDWGRHPIKGHNAELNCILYQSLKMGAGVANKLMGDEDLAKDWLRRAASVKRSINQHLWNEEEGLYTDYVGSDVLSQDGNTLAIWYDVADSPLRVERVSTGLLRNWTKFGAVAPESPQMISPFVCSLELIAHFTAKQPERDMKLLRDMWGYIWNAPYSVQSSLIEGYYHDGRCHYPFTLYDPAYISHAHPWASGPTIVLTQYTVGLRLLDAEHGEWIFEPQLECEEKVTFAMAGFTSSAKGFFSAGWKLIESGIEMAISIHPDTNGTIGVPVCGKKVVKIELDGVSVGVASLTGDGKHVYIHGVRGGRHSLVAQYGS